MLEHALAAARAGFYVFPVAAGTKSPPRGFNEWEIRATRDSDQIRAWWKDEPGANYGIVTNRFGDGNEALVIVDVDVKKGKDGRGTMLELEADGCLPVTYTQRTPNGGYHFFFIVPRGTAYAKNALGAGIDVLSGNMYAVGAGSRIGEGTQLYAGDIGSPVAAPATLTSRLGRALPDAEPLPLVDTSAVDLEAARDRAIRYLETAPEAIEGANGDQTTYKVACGLKDFLPDPTACVELLAEHWNVRCEPPWSYEELEAKVRSAFKNGRNQPGSGAADVAFRNATPLPPTAPTAVSRRKLTVWDINDLKPTGRALTLIDGVLPEDGVSFVYGPSGSGKTFFVLDLAFRIAAGMTWHGRQVTQGAVVYLAAEAPRSVARRSMGLLKHHSPFGPRPTRVPMKIIAEPLNLAKTVADCAALVEEVKTTAAEYGTPVRLIVADTVAQVSIGAEENSATEMGIFMRNVENIAAATGAHVLLVHHSTKNEERSVMRGSGALKGASLTVFALNAKGMAATVEKQKDGETGLEFPFRLHPVEIPAPDDGEPLKEMVALPRAPGGAKPEQLSKQQRAAVEALRAAAANGPEHGATVDAWRAEFERRWVGKAKNAKSRERAFRRVRAELVSLGRVTLENDRAQLSESGQSREGRGQPEMSAPLVSSGHVADNPLDASENALEEVFAKADEADKSRTSTGNGHEDQPRTERTTPWKGVRLVRGPGTAPRGAAS